MLKFHVRRSEEPGAGRSHPVETFLRDVTTEMGIDLDFTVKSGNGIVYVNITGKDTGTIIGKRGQTWMRFSILPASLPIRKAMNT